MFSIYLRMLNLVVIPPAEKCHSITPLPV
jgi:hypothetical protein